MTKIRANQTEVEEILNDPAAFANETRHGSLEIATQAEVDAGVDTVRAITPATLSLFSSFNNWIDANNGVNFTIVPSATGSGSQNIAIGNNASAIGTDDNIAIGTSATSNGSNSISIGAAANGNVDDTIAIGTSAVSTAIKGITIGFTSQSTLESQVNIGNSLTVDDTITNVAYSIKLGYGVADINKNMLHLFSKGKLELYGAEAQFIFPNYEPSGSPATNPLPTTTIDGGMVYSLNDNIMKFYNGTAWTLLAVEQNWLTANNSTDFVTTPTGTGLNSIILGNNAATTTATESIAIGSNVTSTSNSVSIGVNSDALVASSVAVGNTAQAVDGSTIAIGLNSSAAGSSSVAIGNSTSTVAIQSISFGYDNDTLLGNQIAIGSQCKSTSVTTDVTYSVKLGYGVSDANKNMLHLHSKGKLELYGDEAQFILPNYQIGSPLSSLPSTTIDGGMVYDALVKAPKFYDGTTWTEIGPSDLRINAQTGTVYTLALSDKNNLVTMNNAAANTLTIPTNASVAFPIGAQILVEQEGAGTTTITSAGSPPVPTIHSAGNFFDTASRYTTISLIKKASDTWLIVGDLV